MSLYYYNTQREPYPCPVFAQPAAAESAYYKAPMGQEQTIFWRVPFRRARANLTFLEDTGAHREDLIARQQIPWLANSSYSSPPSFTR